LKYNLTQEGIIALFMVLSLN